MFQKLLLAFCREILPIQANSLLAVPIFIVLHHSLHECHNDVIDLVLALSIKPVQPQHMVIPFTD
jgi:hypothetical protein